MVHIEGVKHCTLLYKYLQLNWEWLKCLQCHIWQEFFKFEMSKRQKKKAPVVEEEPEVDVITKTKYIYEETKCISGVEPEYQWGEIYRLITRREVPDMGLEEESIYANIEISSPMKIATRPEIFPCSEIIGWILPRAAVTTMILGNVEK